VVCGTAGVYFADIVRSFPCYHQERALRKASDVHPRHLGRCNDVSAEFRMFYFSDPWFVKYLETVKVEEVCCGCAVTTLCILLVF
jgi:hypothetical protein